MDFLVGTILSPVLKRFMVLDVGRGGFATLVLSTAITCLVV